MLPMLLIALGAILIALSSMITQNTKNLPVDSDVARSNQGIYTMAVIFMSVGVTMIAFGGSANIGQTTGLAFVITLGIVLLVLSAMIVNKTSDKAKNAAIGVLVIGLVFIVGGIASVMTQHADKLKGLVSKKSPVGPVSYNRATDSVTLPAKFRFY